MDRYKAEIINRGFETGYLTGYKGESRKRGKYVEIELIEQRRGLRLYVLDSWKKYSRNTVYPCRLVYLAGVDRGVYWAIRCPSTVGSINQALEYTIPAKVHNARREGRKIIRQGDVFIIQKSKGPDNISDLPSSHQWDSISRIMTHETHKSLHVPFSFSVALGKSVHSNAD